MPKISKNAVYPERCQWGVPPGTCDRIRAVARGRAMLPGEVFRAMLRDFLDKAERDIARAEAEARRITGNGGTK